MGSRGSAWPDQTDFAGPPTPEQRASWLAADEEARPARLARLRDRFEAHGVDAYFGVRRENSRYLTGFVLADGEEKVAGNSGQFLVSGDEVVLLADSRYTIQAAEEAPEARVFEAYHDLPSRWAELLGSVGAKRVAVEAGLVPYATWTRLQEAAPDVDLVPIEGWVEADRAAKEPSELERVAAACAVGDRALAGLLPRIEVGATERALALALEWAIRTGGAEAVAFEPTALAGPRAAMPHGSPTDAAIRSGEVLLFDFGAQVDGYRSDMTRTLFVGEPTARDLAVYELVAAAQARAIETLEASVDAEIAELPSGRELDAIARDLIEADGRWPAYGHGLGHGIGLATHELPSLGRSASEVPLPSPTVHSIEPGIYLEGETGVRIEDLVLVDAAAGRVERLTCFPRDVIVVG
jgi:Xaa-Pro aminopeptidase